MENGISTAEHILLDTLLMLKTQMLSKGNKRDREE